MLLFIFIVHHHFFSNEFPGKPSDDINFKVTDGGQYILASGYILQTEEPDSLRVEVGYVYTKVPDSVSGTGSTPKTFYFMTSTFTNLESQVDKRNTI